ncbi:MAG: tRNA (N6-isopentenyl adenosine(37)-C2)-methylthiotransferase MiaB [Elusimicrobia bacterium]|nr:tRNA (N6-isopentenyl adenosine(37)-C2)-methylthiotransferase MiaB [Elusimicrobiota bacterium]
MRLHTITFGCQMNEADSEEMALPLLLRGFQMTQSLAEADAVIVNTCTVRQHAEHRAVSRIGRLKAWKAARPGRLLIVAGCAAQRLGDAVRRRFPFVDLVVGARSIERYPEILDAALGPKPLEPAGALEPPQVSAYVTITRGCSCACAYCIVPQVRGRESRLPFERVMGRARRLAQGGARELVLLGQTVNGWRDPSAGRDFADILRAASDIPGVARVRFMSPHPCFLDDRMAAAMAEAPAVCPHLHLPAQSGADRILKAMRRGYTRAQFLEKVRRLRKLVKGLNLTTDFIVGFPGESAEDFQGTLELLGEIGATMAYCTKFSPREGTPAAAMPSAVSEEVKEERLERLLAAVSKRQQAYLDSFLGARVRILLETPSVGRTEHNLSARLEEPHAAGEIVEAAVHGRTDFGLKCRRRS